MENKIVYIDDGKHRTERENFMRNPSSVQDYRSTIERVWQKYQQVVQDPEMEAAANLNDVLSADEILLLSEVTPTDKKRGTFFNRLIRNSTYSGEREFQIEGPLYGDSFQGCENIQVDNSGDVGEEYGKLCRNSKFIIGGYAGNHLGYRARGSTFHVKRSVGRECGRLARKCHFTIEGDTYSRCGASAEDSTFVVKGNTYMSFGYRAKNCTFQLHGKALHIQGLGAKAENCTFKTPNKETLEKMLKAIPTEVGTHFETPRQSYNKIVFIHEDGREEKII